jgi:hypothetical protein
MTITSLRRDSSPCFKIARSRAAELRDRVKYLRERELQVS